MYAKKKLIRDDCARLLEASTRMSRRGVDIECLFFFQAEDGIRDYKVTGVQTCALPIYGRSPRAHQEQPAGLRQRRDLPHQPQPVSAHHPRVQALIRRSVTAKRAPTSG